MDKPREIVGSFDAKTHFAEILRQVEEGKEFDITRRGKVIASIVPPHKENHGNKENVFLLLHELKKQLPKNSEITINDILNWRDEGRP